MRAAFHYCISLSILLSGWAIEAQTGCNSTISAGPDKKVCEPGGSVTLNGSASSTPLTILWDPTTGLSNPAILTPNAFVSSTTTYVLTAKFKDIVNLVVNGNFEQGNSAFSTDYTYTTTSMVPEGTYSIVTVGNQYHPGFAPCKDHTTGAGNFMAVNGAGIANQNVWCQTVPVNPTSEYDFSCWLASLVSSNPAQLQFEINGSTIGNIFQAPSSTCVWQQFNASWPANGASSATICILNQNTALGGNDFALDDIVFTELCTKVDSITVEVIPTIHEYQDVALCPGESIKFGTYTISNEGVYDLLFKAKSGCDSIIHVTATSIPLEIQLQPPPPITCLDKEALIDGTSSTTGPEYQPKWTTKNGKFVGNPAAYAVLVDASAWYIFTLTYQVGNKICSKQDSVFVPKNISPPFVDAGDSLFLECKDTSVVLQGKVNASSGLGVQWTTSNGQLLKDSFTINALAGKPGLYQLQVTDSLSGCVNKDTTYVLAGKGFPKSVLNGDILLTCQKNQILLNTAGSDSGPDILKTWYDTGGGIIPGNTGKDSLLITLPGVYKIQVADTSTGCITQDTLQVFEDKNPPQSQWTIPDTLSCTKLSTSLLNVKYQTSFTYTWTSPTGSQLVMTLDSILLDTPGMWTVETKNPANGCSSKDTIIVFADALTPVANTGPNDTLTCLKTELQPKSNNSSQGVNFIYQWSTTNGVITSPVDNLIPVLSAPGIYILQVTNIVNQCVDIDTLVIYENKKLPFAYAGPDQTLTCAKPQINLAAAYDGIPQWIPPVGPLPPAGQKVYSITSPGLYVLTATGFNGCMRSDSVVISQDTLHPPVDAGPDRVINCKYSIITIMPTITGNYGAIWIGSPSPPVSSPIDWYPKVKNAGKYFLIVTDTLNGCVSKDTMIVSWDKDPPLLNAGTDGSWTCKDSSKTLQGIVNSIHPNPDITWSTLNGQLISPPATNPAIIASGGMYILSAMDTVNGCVSSDTILFQFDTIAPICNCIPPELNCISTQGMILGNSTQNVNWFWSTANGNISGATNNSNPIITSGGTYQFICSDIQNGCQDSGLVQVTANITPPIIDAGLSSEITCAQPVIQMNGTVQAPASPVDIQWITSNGNIISGEKSLNPTVSTGGMYLMQAIDLLNNCISVDSVLVVEYLTGPSDATITVKDAGCQNNKGVITIESVKDVWGPALYGIEGLTGPVSTWTFDQLKAGKYTVIITDIHGCTLTKEVVIPDGTTESIDLDPMLEVQLGDSVQLTPVISFPPSEIEFIDWFPHWGLSCYHCLEPWFIGTQSYTYVVKIITKDGCKIQAPVSINVQFEPKIYAPNAFSPNGDGTNDFFRIFVSEKNVLAIESLDIFDRWGMQMYHGEQLPLFSIDAGWDGQYQGQVCNPGVYVWYARVKLLTGESVLVKGDVVLMR